VSRAVASCGAICLLAAAAWADARVETADGRVVAGQLVAVGPAGVVVKAPGGKEQTLPPADVMEVLLAEPTDVLAAAGQAVLLTAADDRLAIRDLAYDGNGLRASTSLLGPIRMKLEAVRAIVLPGAAQTPRDVQEQVTALSLPESTVDRLVVHRNDRKDRPLLSVDGVLQGIDDDRVTFRWQDVSRKVPRETVRLIHLAAVQDIQAARKGVLIGRDGSTVGFGELTLAKDTIELVGPAVGRCSVQLTKVAAIRYASDTMVPLSERKPDAVKEQGFFQTTFPHRKDRSASGKPLRLGGRTYRTGLGLHSYCELLYQLDGKYAGFVATVGIDDAVRPHGDATVHFIGDGRPLSDPVRATGKTDPTPVRLKLEGVNTFLIRVDFGEDGLGFGDHVDLVGARLLRK